MVTLTEQAWEAFHTPLHHFIRRRMADEAAAEDLLQEVFLKIHQHGNRVREARRLESWIYQITRKWHKARATHHRQNTTTAVKCIG